MTSPASEAALTVPSVRVRVPFLLTLSLANLGLMLAFFTPIQNLLPRLSEQIAGADGKEAALAWVTGVGAFVAIVANPLAGALSDRTTSRFGRRRPWILLGALIGAVMIALLSTQTTVVGLAVLWGLGQAAVNAAYSALTAAIPDQVPVPQRGAASGWVGMSQTLGVVLGVALVSFVITGLAGGTFLTGLLLVVLVIPFLVVLNDSRLAKADRPPFHLGQFVRDFWVSPRKHPDFAWAWAARFLVSLGSAMATLYLLFFLQDRVGQPQAEAAQSQTVLIALYAVGTMVTAVIGGIVSDRSGRRKVYVIGASIVMACAALLLVGTTTMQMAMVAALILGLGYGAYLAVDQALITQVLPRADDRARDLGVINIANSAPQVLGPVIAAALVTSFGGYPALYAVTAVITLLGAAAVIPIRSVR
ncbi:MAG: MFS transporter [Actinobacteria bacterium]|uniref:Unannotated protein n=1 Tax=freshwater metagenome TaxID=449393 RepID=A0A6J7L563_9ZZZZ|nr:MFS transporter [Actinomycetota bacterium]MSW42710.1 MFS transporter [Actinomycetota bacterium]